MIEIDNIYNMSAEDGFSQIDDDSIDLIFCDPPYGKKGLYLYEHIAKEAKRVLKDGGFCIFYASDYYLDSTMRDITKYLNYFYLYHHINREGHPSIFPKKILVGAKSIIAFTKGKPRQDIRWLNNVILNDKSKNNHPLNWEQDVDTATQFIIAYSNEGEVILDPVVGSGTTCIAAKRHKRKFLGFDIDKRCYDISMKRINDE